jgi:flagellar basal-body rod modification protein FlgD
MPIMGRPTHILNNQIKIKNPRSTNPLEKNNSFSDIKYVDAKSKTDLGRDGFMKILADQLKNQDPTNPMDQKQMTGDLAQLSQLEQLAKLNTSLKSLGINKNLEHKSYGVSFLGKEVLTRGSSLKVGSMDKNISIPISLPREGVKVLIRINDEKGQLVKQLEQANLPKGAHIINWDGAREDGVRAKPGNYQVEVFATDSTQMNFKGNVRTQGVVKNVSFKRGQTILELEGGKKVFLRDVEHFRLPREKNKI